MESGLVLRLMLMSNQHDNVQWMFDRIYTLSLLWVFPSEPGPTQILSCVGFSSLFSKYVCVCVCVCACVFIVAILFFYVKQTWFYTLWVFIDKYVAV